jgi:flagellar biogenesis protein FliO
MRCTPNASRVRASGFGPLSAFGLRTSAFLLTASTSFAGTTNTLSLHTDLPEVGVSAIRALGALAIVLALFFAGVWVFRNSQRMAWRKTGAPRLAVIESRSLGNRLSIYVVGYDEQRLLIGSSPAGLNLLSQLPPAAVSTSGEAAPPASSFSFATQLQQLLHRK